jgi:hypothetical protein
MRMRGIRRALAAGAVAGTLLAPVPARAITQAEEAGLTLVATWANIFYLPAKAAVALGSIPVGGVAGVLSGGDMRTAYGIWVPAMGGTWFLTNGHLDGSKQLQFFGADYEDTPTPTLRGDDNVIEDVPYRDRSGRYRELPGSDLANPQRYR